MPRPFLRGAPLAVLAAAAAIVACGRSGGDDATEQPEAEAPSERAEPPETPVIDDIRPPDFDGIDAVELVGLEYFRVSWSAAVDDVTPQQDIRYRIYHIVEPYRELADNAAPIFTSEPGATEAFFANDAATGRFYVRAVDAAGNASPITVGLLQRPQRPMLRASDGTLAARISECTQTGPDTAICVGEEGFAARWTGTTWESLDLGVLAPIRIADTLSGVFLYTRLGHLFELDPDGSAHLIDLSFSGRDPALPFRQFTADGVGLRYWVDAEGRVFIGADREFVVMNRPLALPGEECRRLRALAFAAGGNFALCEDGAVFSADPADPGASWLSLTPNAQFELVGGLRGVISDDDTEGVMFDDTGVRRVGVGGWTPYLLTDWRQPGIHPMDVPEDPIPIRDIGQVVRFGERLYAATDLGLLVYDDARWTPVEGAEGAVAGFVAPRDEAGEWTLFYEDGAAARVRRRSRDWIIPTRLSDFAQGAMTRGGDALARTAGRDPSWHVWRDRRWNRTFAEAPAGASVAGFAGAVAGRLLAYGTNPDGTGAIWNPNERWAPARWLYAPPPEPTRASDAILVEDPTVFFAPEPPPPLTGVAAEQLRGAAPAPPPEPITDLDVHADGRAVAVGTHQVWWRLERGWRLLTTRPETLLGAFVDAGETYVLVTTDGVIRCWRDECGELVPQPQGGPTRPTRVVVGSAGATVVDAAGGVWSWSPADGTGVEQMVDPAVETRVGTWVAGPDIGRFAATVQRVVYGDGYAALLDADGAVHERVAERWVLQSEDVRPLALLAVDGTWAILTGRGLFRLGDVRPARREAPQP